MNIRTAISRTLIIVGALLALAIITFCSLPPLRAQTTQGQRESPFRQVVCSSWP